MVFGTYVQKGVGILLILAIVYILLRLFVFRPKKPKISGTYTPTTRNSAINYTGEGFEEKNKRVEDLVISSLKKGLDPKRYSILQNVEITDGDKLRLYDYIVVGDNGAFVIDEKALGEEGKENGIDQTEVFIQTGDVWRIKCKNDEKFLASPTNQIVSNNEFFKSITSDLFMDVHPLLVLANEHLTVHQEEQLPFEVLGTQNLCKYINEYPDKISINDKIELISRINSLKMG